MGLAFLFSKRASSIGGERKSLMKPSIAYKVGQIVSLVSLALMLAILPAPAAEPALAQEGSSLLFIENVGQFPQEAKFDIVFKLCAWLD